MSKRNDNISQNEKTTQQSKRKDNTIVKAKRQHYSQSEKTTLQSKRKDNTIVKAKNKKMSYKTG